MTRHLIIMLKEPQAGRVKTRLARDIGRIDATWWFRHQTARLLRRLQDPRWQITLAVAPDRRGLVSRAWPAHLPRIAQGPGDLGARMARLLHGMPKGPVCIIGGDIPGITPAYIASAFKALGSHDAVFGPAPDGGYWLIGMRRTHAPHPLILTDVRWSTEHALTESAASLRTASLARIATLQDVDTAADLESLP